MIGTKKINSRSTQNAQLNKSTNRHRLSWFSRVYDIRLGKDEAGSLEMG